MDFEASGAQEWTLPGYGRPGFQKNRSEPESSQAQSNPSQPKTRSTTEHVNEPVASVASSMTNNAPSTTPAPTRGAARPYRARGSMRGVIRLSRPFREIRDAFCTAARSVSSKRPFGQQGRNDAFDDICRKTGAYINPPHSDHDVIHLWGASYQVSEATELIQSILARCDTIAMPKKRDWTKTTAYSVGKEELADQLELEDALIQAYRRAPDPSSPFFEKLLFLWPRKGPSIHSALGTELEALDPIRIKYECHLFVPKDLPDHICALGYAQGKTGLIAQLLRNKWAEVMASDLVKSKLYLVEPVGTCQGEITARKEAGFTRTLFRTIPLEESDIELWAGRAELIKSKNKAYLLKVVDRCLKGVIYVRGHLRMRVNLGLFVLDHYRLPADGKLAYGFEEFREMLFHEKTRGRLVPGLLQPYDRTMDSLRQPEPAFSVNFEFAGQKNALLRLEAEFAKCAGARDYAITQCRWLKPRKVGQVKDSRSPLQVGVIDFERSDWQLEIASLEFYEATAVEAALQTFSHIIKFKSNDTMGDISTNPIRKVIFHATAPVTRFIEKTSIRYRLKGTRYILEIARYDEYTRTATAGPASLNLGAPFGDKPRISWGASVFDFAWDNMLGQHANMPLGHSANYDPSLQTFFPASSETEDKTQGLWEFIDLIKRVASLLGSGSPRSTVGTGTAKAESISRSASPASSGNARGLDADLGTLF
ncbi:uncharacterized protein BO97DRAFT_453920 [Aspergillus homomorphus CBS 101889]|uniref:DUF7905 domain-containing protein n=1 Tax=Aspergillus homomorphus (strain CBS 101889) TaxID=1450537 RepID=A0A395HTZ3_ASPHC|nr:hypothetical protein BO97DRAFT_453920 [Aspergillus homomorphus CBS 101889]RAL11411.1 hypothetical protein BO97DRAFT_453920 [Aspergillus homomorphus CBS 101889]